MAMECPNGHGRQNIICNLTADGSNAVTMKDVVAQKLACGCVVGGEQYEKFQKAVAEIDAERVESIRNIEETARQKKGAVYQSFVVKPGEKKHAE